MKFRTLILLVLTPFISIVLNAQTTVVRVGAFRTLPTPSP